MSTKHGIPETTSLAAKQPDFPSWPAPTGDLAATDHIMSTTKSIFGMPGMPGKHDGEILGLGAVFEYMKRSTATFTNPTNGKFDATAFRNAHGMPTQNAAPAQPAVEPAAAPAADPVVASVDMRGRATQLGAKMDFTPRGFG
jgi:hypothetical protein